MTKIISCKSIGKQSAFDLTVDHSDHQFYLANGVLTSNSSHAYAYAVATMQCAHLATYHPLEFCAATLTKGQTVELQDAVSDFQKAGVRILPVSINSSKAAHSVESVGDGKQAVRLSLSSVLGVGGSAVEKIVAGQPYSDVLDFMKRSGVGKTALHPLIKVGAFEELYQNTKDLEEKYLAFNANPKWKQKRYEGEWLARWNEAPIDDYQPHEKVAFETELVGFTLRGSPFEILDREKKIEQLFGDKVVSFKEIMEDPDVEDEQTVMLPVVIKEFKEKAQKNGKMFAFVKFGVATGEEFETPVFSNIWQWVGPKVKKNACYVGVFHKKNDEDDKLFLGRPGWGHTAHSCESYLINIDELSLE